jgi:hypothetical protein
LSLSDLLFFIKILFKPGSWATEWREESNSSLLWCDCLCFSLVNLPLANRSLSQPRTSKGWENLFFPSGPCAVPSASCPAPGSG